MRNTSVKVEKVVLEENLYYNKTVLLNYRIEYPQFFLHEFQTNLNKINMYYKESAYDLQRTCVKKIFLEAISFYEYSALSGMPVREFSVLRTFNVTYNQDCTLSLYFEQYDYMGGTHSVMIKTSDTWDIRTGEKISLCSLFDCKEDYDSYVIGTISNKIKVYLDTDRQYSYFENYEKYAKINFNDKNFFLTSEGIVIYYQHYDIAPYSMGSPEFLIPFDSEFVTMPSCV